MAFDGSGNEAAPLRSQPAEARTGDFDFSAWPDDEDSKNGVFSDPNMFPDSEQPLDDHHPVVSRGISTPNSPPPPSRSTSPIPAKKKKKKVRSDLLCSYVSALVNSGYQRAHRPRARRVVVRVLRCLTNVEHLHSRLTSQLQPIQLQQDTDEESEQEGEQHEVDAARKESSSDDQRMEVRRMHPAQCIH